MDGTFSNAAAAICWGVAIVEFVLFAIYVIFQTNALRKKVVTWGRLVPTVQMVVIAGGIPSNQLVQVAQPTRENVQYPPPQPAGFYQPQDYPPPYSTIFEEKEK